MPRIELRDPVGMCYRLDTLNPWTVHHWLNEWLPRLFAHFPDEEGYQPLVTVTPLPKGDADGTVDWPFDSRFTGEPFRIRRDPHEAMIDLQARRNKLADLIKAEAADVTAGA
jgi:hypothetical protein